MKIHSFNVNLDFIGISSSLLCAIHCAGLPFLLSLAPLAGLKIFHHPVIEYTIITITLIIAIASLRHGFLKHHRKLTSIIIVCIGFAFIIPGHLIGNELLEILLFSIGGLTIAAAHLVNWVLIRRSMVQYPNCVNEKK